MPGFEWELTTKQRFFLYLYELCPNIEIIQSIWKQYINDRDISGFEIIGRGRRLGGPFGDELIAGSYLLKFSFGCQLNQLIIYV